MTDTTDKKERTFKTLTDNQIIEIGPFLRTVVDVVEDSPNIKERIVEYKPGWSDKAVAHKFDGEIDGRPCNPSHITGLRTRICGKLRRQVKPVTPSAYIISRNGVAEIWASIGEIESATTVLNAVVEGHTDSISKLLDSILALTIRVRDLENAVTAPQGQGTLPLTDSKVVRIGKE